MEDEFKYRTKSGIQTNNFLNHTDQADWLMTKVKSETRNNIMEKYLAAAALVVEKQIVSKELLMSFFGWRKGFVNDVLAWLEENRIIGHKRLFRKRKVLANQKYIDLILTDHLAAIEASWITKAFINIQVNDEFVKCDLNPEFAKQLCIGDKWIVRKCDLDELKIGKPFLEEKDQYLFKSDKSIFFKKFPRICFILITERFFHENTLELHGRYDPPDSLFYQ